MNDTTTKDRPAEEISTDNWWNLNEALGLCFDIEKVCPKYGCHVALTGGLLYKGGIRKDCDLIFYRHRQTEEIDVAGLFPALQEACGLTLSEERAGSSVEWCRKAIWRGKAVDCLFPEGFVEIVEANGDVNIDELAIGTIPGQAAPRAGAVPPVNYVPGVGQWVPQPTIPPAATLDQQLNRFLNGANGGTG